MTAGDFDSDKSVSDQAKETAGKVSAAAHDAGQRAASTAGAYRDAARDAANDLGDKAGETFGTVRDAANDAADSLKDQARQHAGDARDIVSSFADEARAKVAGIVDDQKNRGADQLDGFSRAAQSAAGELEENNPAVARLMRDAATTVEHLADDLRTTDLRNVVASVSDFARQQPVAFFAASVVFGFMLARFVKSDGGAGGRPTAPTRRPARI